MKRWAIGLSMGVSIAMIGIGVAFMIFAYFPSVLVNISWDKGVYGLGAGAAIGGLGFLSAAVQQKRATGRDEELDNRIANRVIEKLKEEGVIPDSRHRDMN